MKSRIFLSFLLVFLTANIANPQATSRQIVPPDVYELTGGQLHVTYTTTSKNGQPYFSYQDGSQNLSFKGKEIRQVKSEFGTLVTVTIHMTVDAGSTMFTLLVPSVRLEEFSPAQIHTVAITTAHKFSVIPAMNLGQTETYTTTELSGTAKMVMF
ncbi:MAG TPA: hypothetical protein VI685_07705 [Candidatus Angelobacter sp.]